MARGKTGHAVNGWLVLDKPLGLTSTQALGAVKRLLRPLKAGHAGTLDPLATGVLPLALGEATKTVPFAVDGEKTYRFTVRWGAETTTDDTEGAVTARSDRRPTAAEIEALLPAYVGEILQVPPAFSAIKIDGRRAYDLARAGEEVEMRERPVLISELSLAAAHDDSTSEFVAVCGKGTYVRALARDMGRDLGCFGHVIALRRTRVGPFSEERAVTLQDLERTVSAGDAAGYLLPIEAVLGHLPQLPVTASDAASLHQGQPVLIRGRDAPILSGLMFATCRGRLVALGEVDRGALRPTRVFNL